MTPQVTYLPDPVVSRPGLLVAVLAGVVLVGVLIYWTRRIGGWR